MGPQSSRPRLWLVAALAAAAATSCPSSCSAPACKSYDDTGQAWVHGQCIGFCNPLEHQAYCSSANWGQGVDCSSCPGLAPAPCVEDCGRCLAYQLGTGLLLNGTCRAFCAPSEAAPEYEHFCFGSWVEGDENTIDCTGCVGSAVEGAEVAPTTPLACISSGMVRHPQWGSGIRHCTIGADPDACEVYQALNGDDVINPSGTCRGFCSYFGLACVGGWSDPDNGCFEWEDWQNSIPANVGCDHVGDPPEHPDRFTPDHICSCVLAPEDEASATEVPSAGVPVTTSPVQAAAGTSTTLVLETTSTATVSFTDLAAAGAYTTPSLEATSAGTVSLTDPAATLSLTEASSLLGTQGEIASSVSSSALEPSTTPLSSVTGASEQGDSELPDLASGVPLPERLGVLLALLPALLL